MGYFCALLVVLTSVTVVLSFNIEYRNPIVKRGEKGSYFGYSVAQHKSSTSNLPDSNW